MVEAFGTVRVGRGRMVELMGEHFDLRPVAVGGQLRLHQASFQKTAAYGHFGRENHDFTWERVDKADALRQAAGLGATEAAL